MLRTIVAAAAAIVDVCSLALSSNNLTKPAMFRVVQLKALKNITMLLFLFHCLCHAAPPPAWKPPCVCDKRTAEYEPF